MRSAITVLLCCLAGAILVVPAASAPLSADSQQLYDAKVKPFLTTHCIKCHNDKKANAGLRIDNLGTDFLAGKTADHWKEIIDNINLGKMPPKSQDRPNPKEAFAVVEWVAQELRNAEKLAKNSSGRIPTRRLNRTEYVDTLRDLFHLDENVTNGLLEELPPDGTVDGFDRGGASLFLDENQLDKYLELADLVVDRYLFGPKPKMLQKKKYMIRDIRWLNPKDQDKFVTLEAYPGDTGLRGTVRVPVGANWYEMKNGGCEFISGLVRRDCDLECRNGTWFTPTADPLLQSTNVQDGWYRVKIRAGAFKGTGAHAVDAVKFTFRYTPNTPVEAKASIVIDAPLDKPRDYETKVFLRLGSPNIPKRYDLSWNGTPKVVIANPETDELQTKHRNLASQYQAMVRSKRPASELQAQKKKVEEAIDNFHKAMLELKPAYVYNPELDLKALPRLWLESVEIEGPIDDWPAKGRTELFFKGETRTIDQQYIREIFANFLPRAYRRPVEPQEIDDVVSWVLKFQTKNKSSGTEAVKAGVKMVLCSPGFLLIQEPTGSAEKPRQLTDYELASRLSYFLWSTMPDKELFELAAANKLHEPKTLTAQVRRMLADPKGQDLVQNFVGQWLKVRDFHAVTIDRRFYRTYDEALRESSQREPFEFFREVLEKDLSVLNFVDSDFLVINERLARHYGIEGVRGDHFRKVAIRPEHCRGGILGMAGVLAYLSDGARTLPVRRAAYVLETLWNAPPPPPPPDAGELPVVKGKSLSVRQRLDMHRSVPACASCHTRIDPFGMALENYDAVGAWRDRQNGWGYTGDSTSPPLDVSGALPSGRKFKDLPTYKQALLAEKDRFIRGFTEKLLAYALGRPIGATDREMVEQIIAEAERKDYHLQAFLQALVAHRAFQTK
jgi:mono/diheme cytochrome c family protein